MAKRTQKPGFTIVELLIVIVVIAILAAISIVAYNGIQQRARDTQRKSDLSQIAKALNIYNIDNGNFIEDGSGCGAGGNGNGFFNVDYTGYSSMVDCLIDAGDLSQELIDPLEQSTSCASGIACRRYMKASCPQGTWLYASLESEAANVDDTDLVGTCASAWDTSYGMNYVLKVN